MLKITTQLLEVACVSNFKKPVLFENAKISQASQAFFEALAGYGLKPTQVVVMRGDEVFNYQLAVTHFNGHGEFKLTAEKLEIQFRNARSPNDLEIVKESVAHTYDHVPLPDIRNTIITITAHATTDSKEELEKYLSAHADASKGIVEGGVLAFIKCENWAQKIRVAVERSLVYQENGLFLSLSTGMDNRKPVRSDWKNLEEASESSVTKLGLEFTKRN